MKECIYEIGQTMCGSQLMVVCNLAIVCYKLELNHSEFEAMSTGELRWSP